VTNKDCLSRKLLEESRGACEVDERTNKQTSKKTNKQTNKQTNKKQVKMGYARGSAGTT
jgi:hypothetical protein